MDTPEPREYLLQYRDERDGYIPQYAPRKEWGSDTSFGPYDVVDIANRVHVLLLSVMRNALGQMVYIIQLNLEDPDNLLQSSVSFELWVNKRSVLSIIQLSSEEVQTFKLPRGYHVLPDAIQKVENQAVCTIQGVMANNIGDIIYFLYLKDEINLSRPVGGDLYIRADGKLRLEQAMDPEEFLLGRQSEQKE